MEKILTGSSEFISGRDSMLIDLSSWYKGSLAPKIEVIQNAIENRHIGFAFTGMELACLLVGTVVSFIVSLFVLRFLMGYIKKHDFKVFGWYRIVLGIIVLLYFLVFA